MNDSPPSHPTKAQLGDFLLGRFDESQSADIEDHIEGCQPCCELLGELNTEADPFVSPLQSAADVHDSESGRMAQQEEQPPTAAHRSDDAIGSWIDRYKLVSILGEGGMGVVYQAQQDRPVRRSVALKIIKSNLDRRQVIARFEAERQALALMDHVHITRVLDAGTTEDGRPYFVTELIDGLPITEYCENRRLGLRQRIELFIPVCHAIQHAHQKRIIHRDIKPSNVLVAHGNDQSVPKVIDFGIAKALEGPLTERTLATRYGQIVGTLEYMSPEQAALSGRDIDTRSDIYALGVLLYELLTGTTPLERSHQSDSALDEMLREIRELDPKTPSSRLSGCDATRRAASQNLQVDPQKIVSMLRGDLDAIVMKALEKDRDQRYASAAELAADLQRFLEDAPVEARPQSTAYRLKKVARRHRKLVAFGAIVALVLLSSTAVSVWQMRRASESEFAASKSRDAAMRRLWQSHLERARAARFSRESGQRFTSLSALGEAALIGEELDLGPEARLALRNEAIACMVRPDLRLVHEWPIPSPFDYGAAMDPAHPRFAHGSADGPVFVRGTKDGRKQLVLSSDIPIRFLQFSPKGDYLAGISADAESGVVWELASERPIIEVANVSGEASFAFSQDGRQVAFGRESATIDIYRLQDGQRQQVVQTTAPPRWMAFDSSGGRMAVSAKGDDTARVIDLDTRENLATLPHPRPVEGVAWGANNQSLATACRDGRVYLWDVRSSLLRSVMVGHQSATIHIAFSPHGNLLASQSWDGTTRVWDAVLGREIVRADTKWAYQWNNEGTRLAGGAGEVFQIWEVASGNEHRLLHHGRVGNSESLPTRNGGPWSAVFSPDGRLLASASFEGVRLWDCETTQQLGHLTIGRAESVLFQPDGSLLTHTAGRLQHWPISRTVEAEKTVMVVGPPKQLAIPQESRFKSAAGRLSQDHDGNVRAIAQRGGDAALVWNTAETNVAPFFIQSSHLADIVVSPDGRWVAASNWGGGRFTVWDIQKRSLVLEIAQDVGYATFSPDSQQLLAGLHDEFRVWDVGKWEQPAASYPHAASLLKGFAAYSPDGRMLAMAHSNRAVRLVDARRHRDVATLDGQDAFLISGLSFSPSGNQLAVATENHVVQLWDLRQIHAHLSQLNLQWEPAPQSSAAHGQAVSLSMRVIANESNQKLVPPVAD